MSDSTVRAIWWAAKVPEAPAPFDTIHLKAHYPAAPTGDDIERLTGMITPDRGGAPYPVVLVLPGINVGPDSYRWVAERLVRQGFVVVTYTWVGEIFPGQYGVTPGLDLSAATPDAYGTRPTASAIPALLHALTEVNVTQPLEGLLDLSRVALIGHSAGGTVALQAANEAFFPSVKAVVSYAGHNEVSTLLGWPPASIPPLAATCPTLLVGGTEDGVMRNSADRYGEDAATRKDPMLRTFDEAIPGGRDDAWMTVIQGANHFSSAWPVDPTSARSFLDLPETADPAAIRDEIADVTVAFLRAYLLADAEAEKELARLVDDTRDEVATAGRK